MPTVLVLPNGGRRREASPQEELGGSPEVVGGGWVGRRWGLERRELFSRAVGGSRDEDGGVTGEGREVDSALG